MTQPSNKKENNNHRNMDLIAKKDFYRVAALKAEGIADVGNLKDEQHPNMIHKGARFSLGTGKTVIEIRKTNAALAEVLAHLFYAGCVGDSNDKEVVKAVEDEIAADRKREASIAKLNKAANEQAFRIAAAATGAK